jgi:hypothetical protein
MINQWKQKQARKGDQTWRDACTTKLSTELPTQAPLHAPARDWLSCAWRGTAPAPPWQPLAAAQRVMVPSKLVTVLSPNHLDICSEFQRRQSIESAPDREVLGGGREERWDLWSWWGPHRPWVMAPGTPRVWAGGRAPRRWRRASVFNSQLPIPSVWFFLLPIPRVEVGIEKR